MNKQQIAALDATEHTITESPRKQWWHYRRTPATRQRDAVWQYADRSTDAIWQTIQRPPAEVLSRLESRGSMTHDRIRWHGFHDPAEFAKGN